ncbi:MAG: protein phosphatase 2C domain-containing protein [Burkholderiaceae bacterium]
MKRQQTRPARLRIQACIEQHVGDRTEQQDRVVVLGTEPGAPVALGVLADGLGGRSGGSLAADNVVLTASQRLREFVPGRSDPVDFFRSLVQESHTILRLSAVTSGTQPHSTLAAVLMQPDRIDWCHVGDSRIYHIRDRRLMHCTADHTYAEELIRKGLLSRDRAHLHPRAGMLVNALGSARTPEPTFGRLDEPQPGDTFLLCSDGLWNYFHAGEIVLVLHEAEPADAARTLVGRARERAAGMGDNCSLAIMRFGLAETHGRRTGARPVRA